MWAPGPFPGMCNGWFPHSTQCASPSMWKHGLSNKNREIPNTGRKKTQSGPTQSAHLGDGSPAAGSQSRTGAWVRDTHNPLPSSSTSLEEHLSSRPGTHGLSPCWPWDPGRAFLTTCASVKIRMRCFSSGLAKIRELVCQTNDWCSVKW